MEATGRPIKSVSSEELGIISSSIAHELNNPLGGILAGLSVLLLEDLEMENRLSLEEMKRGTERCRQLINIFLGNILNIVIR